MAGDLGILNVGAGDTKLSFDPKKPEDVKRARRAVEDMLKRGFAIFIQVGKDKKGPLFRRAEGFDPKTDEYLIVGTPEDEDVGEPKGAKKGRTEKAARRKTSRVPASRTNAVAVSRSAGG